jgi:glyoxylase-like metal-dependent hydrolase (beta-lactamase superfamily II)
MLDKRVARLDRAVVLTTIRWHRRSRDAFVERYGATSQAPGRLPAGVEAFPVPAARETMFWLPAPRALVPGDALLTRAGDGLRLCPTSWLRALGSPTTRQELAVALEPLLDLPIELIVTSHGPPVLSGGRRELARALAHGRRSAPPP